MELFYSKEIAGGHLFLRGDEASHCIRVLRKKAGDEIFVIDGNGGFYRCEILPFLGEQSASDKKGKGKQKGQKLVVEAVIKDRMAGQGESLYELTMAVCPTKNMERFEWFVEKATEFGVNKIVPIVSSHSVRTTVKHERLESVALAATKQSLKAYIPVIEQTISVKDFLTDNFFSNLSAASLPSADLAEYDFKLIAHCAEGEKLSIREALGSNAEVVGKRHRNEKYKPKIVIMIGPEGDFTAEEIELSKKLGFKAITLGKSRLRVETAALAAVCEVYFSI